MTQRIEVSIVVETHNIAEGGDLERFEHVLESIHAMLERHDGAEVLVADACGAPEIGEILERAFPAVTRIHAVGLGYDGAKMRAAEVARGTYVLYCDSDCLPTSNWSEAMVAPLESGKAVATGGFTVYEGGFWQAVATILDFGFLHPRAERWLECYASNSCGFVREVLVGPARCEEGYTRCACYFHAQRLRRRGTPVLMVPDVVSLHAPQPVVPERSRRGYDAIAVCWTDPDLPDARYVRLGLLAVPLFYARDVALDWRRVWAGRRDLGLSVPKTIVATALFPLVRLLDAAGMVRAVFDSPHKSGWGGWHARGHDAT